MFKGLGFGAMFVFAIVASQIGGMEPVFGIYFISLIFVSVGVLAFSLLQFPGALEGNKVQKLLEFSKLDLKLIIHEIDELAVIIRRDGLLVAESYRKNLKDKKLQYLVKRSMDGFEKKQLLSWVESQASFQEEQFSLLQNFLDRVLLMIPVVGLLGSVLQLMHQPVSLASAFVPFLIALVAQLLLQALVQENLNESKRRSHLYYALLTEGISGIMDGVTAEFIREQLAARMGLGYQARPGQP